MSDEHDLAAGFEVLEVMRKRVTHVRGRADSALAELSGRLGEDDDALNELGFACAEYHFALRMLFDMITASGLKRGDWKPR